MLCDKEFRAEEEVNLSGAQIGGQLSFRTARLNGKEGPALSAPSLKVTADMYCDEGFQADGAIDLAGARNRGPPQLHWRALEWQRRAGAARPDAHGCHGHALR